MIARRLARICAGFVIVVVALVSGPASAAFAPQKPVEIVVHTGPGGGNDVLARAIAAMVEKENLLPVRLVVVNKPGGNGAVAAAYLAEKKGDPHVIGLITSAWIVGPMTTAEAKVTLQDLTPIAQLVLEPAVVAVRADAPFRTMKDFVDAAKAKPGELKQSGGSLTARDAIMRQVLQNATGTRWAFISFPGGGERIAALLGGHVNMMIVEPQEAGENLRAGKMRLLAQVADKRLPAFPDVPTLKEAGFDVPLVPQMRGAVAPPAIAPEVTAYWQDFFRRLTGTVSWRRYLEDNQFQDGFNVGKDFIQSLEDTSRQLRQLLQETGVKLVR
ncbi:MAG TPA: tripartite tricarboxylate transporter substrate binding protein [Casimicrobiaceae bacterium]|nr:tripartite tricarboxylate transporter substrate binding protein [Casimicrobiaceae bacterium]